MSKKILVVDYEEKSLDEIREIFQGGDFSLLFARNGQQASEVFRAEIPELILTSALLPKVNGFELSKMISSGQLGMIRPVIIYSNIYKAEKYRREATVVSGASEFLEKPFNREQLVSLVGELIHDSRRINEPVFFVPDGSDLSSSEVLLQAQSQKAASSFSHLSAHVAGEGILQADILDMEFLDQVPLLHAELAKTEGQLGSEEILDFVIEPILVEARYGKPPLEELLVQESLAPSSMAREAVAVAVTEESAEVKPEGQTTSQTQGIVEGIAEEAPSKKSSSTEAAHQEHELFTLYMSAGNQTNKFREIFLTILVILSMLAFAYLFIKW
jgi:CheY-like chemotaxis protein